MKRSAHGLMGIEVEKIAVIVFFFFPELIRRGIYSRIQYIYKKNTNWILNGVSGTDFHFVVIYFPFKPFSLMFR